MNRLWMRETDRVLLWSGSTCGHFYMIGISNVAFSAQAAIILKIMSSIFYSTHFPLLSNAQQCTVASSTIASSIWLLTHLLLHSLQFRMALFIIFQMSACLEPIQGCVLRLSESERLTLGMTHYRAIDVREHFKGKISFNQCQ